MSQDFRVGFCVSGNGYLAKAAILHKESLGISPIAVFAESGTSIDLERFCVEHGVQFIRHNHSNRKAFDDAITENCINAGLDLMMLTFNKILTSTLVAHYHHKIINYHPALLPAFRGYHGFSESVLSDAKFIGATLHEVIDAVDEGPIVAQVILGKRRSESTESVGRRLFGPLRQIYLQVISWYVQGRVEYTDEGRVYIREAVYGEFPISPSVEESFPD